MKEIDIFDFNDDDINNIVYSVPVKLIIRTASFEDAKRRLTISKTRSTISFQNVTFNNEVSINVDDGIDQEISISFHNCFIDSFSSFALKSKDLSISLSGCIVKHFKSQNVDLKSIRINNCFGTFFLSQLKYCFISYTEENIFVRDWYRKSPIEEILSYKTNFYLSEIENINIYGSEIDDERREELLKQHKNFYPDNNPRNKKIIIKKLLTDIEKAMLNLNVSLTYQVPGVHKNTSLRNLPLNSISITGRSEGEISIENCKIDSVYIRNFSPKGFFTLYNIETRGLSKGKFEVNNSNLDNTWFNSVKLNQYFIVFFKSSFINTKFYSTIFPSTKELLSNSLSSIENIHYPNKKSEERAYNRDMYELFLELKQAFEKRGNIFESQKMKAVAQDFLYKVESNNLLKSDFWNNKFILLLNRISNFHGVSLRNAFLWIIGFILLFHWLNVLSYKSYYLTFNSWEEMYNIFNYTKRYVFVLANPVHRVSSLAPADEITGYTYLISFSSRLVVGYLYYQFIAAFRRFGK